MLPKDAFDFCKVEDVKDCQELLNHVSSAQDEAGNAQERKGFFSRIFTSQSDQESDTVNLNLPKITAMCVVNPAVSSN